MSGKTILFYGIPAHGHIHPTLPLVQRLARQGDRVVYYALPPFREAIEASGAEFRAYPLGDRELDLRDGSRLFRFYRLLLEMTLEWVDFLTAEARELGASLALHDSAAHWGLRVAQRLRLPAASFCPLIAINHPLNASFWAYAGSFSPVLWKDLRELPAIAGYRARMRREYGFCGTGMLRVMMSWERLNILSCAREMQVGGSGFDQRFFFLGPAAILRRDDGGQVPPAGPGRLIYLSLGTIFNDNMDVYRRLFRELGGTRFRIVVAAGDSLPRLARYAPPNVTLVRYADQRRLLRQADAFLTAGGMNSLAEAVSLGVPCLVCPQQGEQRINGRQLEKLGFGLLLKPSRPLLPQLEQAMSLRKTWDAGLAKRLTAVRMEELLRRLRNID